MIAGRATPPNGSIRRKASIEIYFVLYLSAIILLLGTAPAKKADKTTELEAAIVQLLAPDFEVKANRAALLYYFVPAGARVDTTNAPLRRDSINLIFAVGEIDDVEFNIVSIVDSTTGRELPLDRATLVKDGPRRSIFQWSPLGETENAVYSITVEGRARPLPPHNIVREDLRQKIEEILQRAEYVADSVTFTVNLFALNRPLIVERRRIDSVFDAQNTITTPPASVGTRAATSGPSGALELWAANSVLTVQPRSVWRNRIGITGAAANDLDIRPERPDVQIVGRGQGWIEVGGLAPAVGKQAISVMIRRTSDGAMLRASFDVQAMDLKDPSVPETFFVGETYDLDFAPGDVPGAAFKVEILDGNGTILVPRTSNSGRLRFRPGSTGTVQIRRYLDNQILRTYSAEVTELPIPYIPKPTRDGKDALVTTVSFGTLNRVDNLANLIVSDGDNASEPVRVGAATYEKETKKWTQVWRISRIDRQKPLEFVCYALDMRGSGIRNSKGFKEVHYSDN